MELCVQGANHTRQLFVDKTKESVPSWMFIKWIPQMLSGLSGPEGELARLYITHMHNIISEVYQNVV